MHTLEQFGNKRCRNFNRRHFRINAVGVRNDAVMPSRILKCRGKRLWTGDEAFFRAEESDNTKVLYARETLKIQPGSKGQVCRIGNHHTVNIRRSVDKLVDFRNIIL